MSPPRPLGRSVVLGVALWTALGFALLSVELALGTWSLADLAHLPGTDDLRSFGVVAAATLVLVVASVVGYRRWRLVAPLVLLALYAGYFAALGTLDGIPTWPFVAALYAPLVVPAVLLAAGVEYLLRRRRLRRSPA